MSFEMNYDDFDPEDVGGKDQVQAGDYHFLIETVDEDGEGGAMEIDMQVLRGTTSGQEGKVYKLKLKKDYGKWPQRKLAAFAIASRLRTAKQIKENKEQRKSDPIEWTQAQGRTVCMKLERSEDGKWINLAWDSIWSPDDKRAAHIPLHAAALQRDGIKLPANRPIDGVLAGKQQQLKQNASQSKKQADVATEDLLNGVV